MVEDGDVIAALILPADLLDKLRSLASLNPEQPMVEVLVNQDDPVKASLVDDRIQALITEANLILAQQISDQAATLSRPARSPAATSRCRCSASIDILGLDRAAEILRRSATSCPPTAPPATRSTR